MQLLKRFTTEARRAQSFLGLVTAVLTLVFLFQFHTINAAQEAALPLVLRVYYDQIGDIDRLVEYDVWEVNNLAEKYVLVGGDTAVLSQLQAAGWRVEIDQALTDELDAARRPDLFAGGYRTVDELYADLTAVAAAYPAITQLVDYGDSYCKQVGGCTTPGGQSVPGFDLQAIRVTNRATGGQKPVFFLMADLHAREITTPEIAMRMLDWLVDGYGADADVTWLVDYQEIWIVPTANPDGHRLVELGAESGGDPYYQRKNANATAGCTIAWPPTTQYSSQYGVDLNRNHSFKWGILGGSSTNPCAQTYRGTSSASEPEITALENLARSLIPDQRGPGENDAAPDDTQGIFITMHSYSQMILWPWGYANSPAPNKAGLQAIGDKMATYNGYRSCQPAVPECLYAASGTSDDWAYGELGIPAFTFELGNSFMPLYDTIDAEQWPDNGPALQYAAKIARRPYQLAFGPDTLNITTTLSANQTVTLTATIDDRDNGSRLIDTAVYTIDTPPWITNVITYTLSASDGSFDNAVEGVTAVTLPLSPGQHILYLQGQDADGRRGPVSAIFVDIPFTAAFYLPLIANE